MKPKLFDPTRKIVEQLCRIYKAAGGPENFTDWAERVAAVDGQPTKEFGFAEEKAKARKRARPPLPDWYVEAAKRKRPLTPRQLAAVEEHDRLFGESIREHNRQYEAWRRVFPPPRKIGRPHKVNFYVFLLAAELQRRDKKLKQRSALRKAVAEVRRAVTGIDAGNKAGVTEKELRCYEDLLRLRKQTLQQFVESSPFRRVDSLDPITD
jgi:hypothetical protein